MLPEIVLMPNRSERANLIVESILKVDNLDIIVFQEAFNKKAVDIIKSGLSEKYPYVFGPFLLPKSPIRTNSGVMVFSKIPLELIDSIEFKMKADFDALAKKGAVLLQGIFEGKKFQILGTHMQAQNYPKIRQAQFNQIDKMLDIHLNSEIPQILCGDFNTPIDVKGEYSYMVKCLKVDDCPVIGNSYESKTNKLIKTLINTTIDYILIRNNNNIIKTTERKIMIFKPNGKDISDHYAVFSKIDFGKIII